MDHLWLSNNFDLEMVCGDFNSSIINSTNNDSDIEYNGNITDKIRLMGDQYSLLN